MRKLLLAAGFALLVLSSLPVAVSGQTPPPRIIAKFASNYTGVQPPGRYVDLALTVSELDPGALVPTNSFTATRYFSVVEGTPTVTLGSETKEYAAGTNFVVPSGVFVRISNEGKTAKVQLFVSSLRVAGAQPVSALAPGVTPPAVGPRVVANGILQGIVVPTDNVTVQQAVQEYEAGAKNSPHTMNHPHLFVPLGGENTTKYLDGTTMRLTSGQAGSMTPGKPGIMENTGPTTARMYFAWVLTPGTPNTSPVTGTMTAIRPPAAGDSGLAGADEDGATLPLLAVIGAALLLLAVSFRRASRV